MSGCIEQSGGKIFMSKIERPGGLTALGIVNFVFAGLTGFSFLIGLGAISHSAYTIASPLITIALMVVSGIGFMIMSYRLGYLGGNAFGVLSILNILVYMFTFAGQNFLVHIPSLIYPTIVLILINTKFKKYFS